MEDNIRMSAASTLVETIDKRSPSSEAQTPAIPRRYGRASCYSLADQAAAAAAGFGVNLLLARWLSASDYGIFAVVFAAYLFLSGFHNVLLLEPLSVLGPAFH